MRAKSVSITELPPSPDAERHSRMIKYAVTQAIRVMCIVAVVLIHGWWALIPAVGAIFLPYFAVVAANNVRRSGTATVQRPGSIVPVRPSVPNGPESRSASAKPPLGARLRAAWVRPIGASTGEIPASIPRSGSKSGSPATFTATTSLATWRREVFPCS